MPSLLALSSSGEGDQHLGCPTATERLKPKASFQQGEDAGSQRRLPPPCEMPTGQGTLQTAETGVTASVLVQNRAYTFEGVCLESPPCTMQVTAHVLPPLLRVPSASRSQPLILTVLQVTTRESRKLGSQTALSSKQRRQER